MGWRLKVFTTGRCFVRWTSGSSAVALDRRAVRVATWSRGRSAHAAALLTDVLVLQAGGRDVQVRPAVPEGERPCCAGCGEPVELEDPDDDQSWNPRLRRQRPRGSHRLARRVVRASKSQLRPARERFTGAARVLYYGIRVWRSTARPASTASTTTPSLTRSTMRSWSSISNRTPIRLGFWRSARPRGQPARDHLAGVREPPTDRDPRHGATPRLPLPAPDREDD